jgi:DNA-binding transcriptional LysR family regulator
MGTDLFIHYVLSLHYINQSPLFPWIRRATRCSPTVHDGPLSVPLPYVITDQIIPRWFLADMDDAETSLSGASTLPRGRLRVDVPSPLASMILVPALSGFYRRYPDIQIDMGVSDRIVDMIGENVDCVVRGGEIKDQSLMARKVGDLQLGVFAAPSYLARVGIPAHPRELEDSPHRIVGFLWARTGKAVPYALHNHAERIQIKGRYALAVDDGNAYLAAGLAGLGVLWLPKYMSNTFEARGELVPLFENWSLDPMPIYVAFPPNRHISIKLRVFIDWVAELMGRL